MSFEISLEDFQVSPERGFLPIEDPLLYLPEYYAPWDQAADELPKRLMSGRVRSWLASLPRLHTDALSDRPTLDRAMLLLSYFGSAWVWGEPTANDRIPENLALPWKEIAARLGRPPILSYASHALNNWRRLDPGRGIELDNVVRLLNFYGGLDEEWFVLIHIVIEAKAGPAIAAAVDLRRAVAIGDERSVTEILAKISSVLRTLQATLERMPERCDPYIYYRRVRPFIFGWAGNPALPHGVFYEGVAEWNGQGQKFRGETGAQSAIIPALDATLGIRFNGNEAFAEHLMQLRDYMPPKHREFVERLEAEERRLSCRAWIAERGENKELITEYNDLIAAMAAFRRQHLAFAGAYIARQEPQASSNPTGTGTGGTPFMAYLRDHADQTLAHQL